MLEGTIGFALAAIAIANIAAAVEHAFAASYYRAISQDVKTRLEESKTRRELLEQMKNPEWEPVEDEPDESDAAQSYWRRKKDEPENATE